MTVFIELSFPLTNGWTVVSWERGATLGRWSEKFQGFESKSLSIFAAVP